MTRTVKFIPLGPGGLTVEFGNEISTELNGRVIELARFFENNPFPGLEELTLRSRFFTTQRKSEKTSRNFRRLSRPSGISPNRPCGCRRAGPPKTGG
jgi:hypothetical protein